MDKPITDNETIAESPQSFDPADTDGWRVYSEPCPECGGTEFLEESQQQNVVKCTDEGVPEEFIPQTSREVTLRVWCRECDTLLLGEEE